MRDEEIAGDYEKNTGQAIVQTFAQADYVAIPAVLVANHGPFTWGPNQKAAAHNAVILESVARMAYFTLRINQNAEAIGRELHAKHFLRKHGSRSYYGQTRNNY